MQGKTGTKQRYIILGILFLTWIINYLDKLAINVAVIPIGKEFNLNDSQIGLIISVFFMSYAVMQLIGGWLSDKYGARRIILISVLLWSIFTVLTGFAWSFVSLIIIRLFFGFAEGSFPSASSLAIAETFPKVQRGRAKSVLTSATTLGSLLATLIAASLITTLGWRSLFYLFGILGIVMMGLLFVYLKTPNQAGLEHQNKKVPLKRLLKTSMLWQLMIMYFGVSIVNWGLTSWMPSYLVKVRDMELVSMGLVSMIPALVGFVAVLTTGWLIDKYMVGREKYLIIMGAIISGICIYFMANASSITMIIVFQSITVTGGLLATTTILTLPLKYFSHEVIGTATGFMYFGGQMAGALSPSIMGFIITTFNGSYRAAFIFLMVALIIPIITACTLHTKEKDTGEMKINGALNEA